MNILERLTQPHQSIQDEAEQRLIRFFLLITLIGSVTCWLAYFPLSSAISRPNTILVLVALVIAFLICYFIGRTQYVHWGLHLTQTLIYLIVLGIVLASATGHTLVALVFPILSASIFLSLRWMLGWGAICFTTAIVIANFVQGDWEQKTNNLTLIFVIMLLNGIGVFLRNQNALEARKELKVRLVAEAALRENRHFVEQITAAAPDYIYVHDFAQGKRVYENKSWLKILGYPPSGADPEEGDYVIKAIHPDDRAALVKMRQHQRVAKDGEIIKLEYRLRYVDGTWHWLYSRSMVFKRDAQGVPTQVLGMVQDTTDYRAAENAVRESRHFVEQITAAAPDYIYVYDISKEQVVYENRSWKTLIGFSQTFSAEEEQKLLVTLIHPEDQARFLAYRQQERVAANGDILQLEYRVRYADDTWHWLYSRKTVFKRDAQGVPTQVLGIVQDVTDRHTVQEALRESRHFVEQITVAAPDYIYVYDFSTEQVVYENRAWETLIGASQTFSTEKIQSLWVTMIHPEDQARFLAYRQQERLVADGDVLQFEYRIRYADDTWHWLYRRTTIFKRDSQGNPIQVLGIVQDITERRVVEEQLRDSRHFIEQITRMSPDLVYVIDLETNEVVYGNRSWDELLAKLPRSSSPSQEDAILRLVHPDDKTAFLDIRKRQAEAQDGEVLGIEYRIGIAERVWLWLYSRHMVFKRDAQGKPRQILGITQNITLRKSMEEAENERRILADILRETSAIVNSSLDTEEVLELIADNIHRVVEADGVTVMLIDGDQIQLSVVRGVRQDAGNGGRIGRAACSVIELTVLRKILETQMALRIPDVRQVPEYVSLPDIDSIHAYLGIPLWARGQIIGVIHLENRIPDFYTERHVEQLHAFAEQVSSALQNAHLHEQSQLLSASNERQRIARDLHDSVTQTLFAASMVAQTLPILWDTNRDGVRGQLDNLSVLTRGALADMRTLLVELRPSALENADIGELLGYLLDALATRHQVAVTLALEGKERLPGEIQIAFYRIAQEGLNNIAKHARAKQVTVRLVRHPHQVKLTITDDGRGFDLSGVGNDHFGLSIMKERADSVGATLTVNSAPGQGCYVEIAWQNNAAFVLLQEGIR